MGLKPSSLINEHWPLLGEPGLSGPVLDLACGEGQNGIFVALKGFRVVCCDRSAKALGRARETAQKCGARVEFRQVDLETRDVNPLGRHFFRAVLVFRYLHRPLIPVISGAVMPGGYLYYETFTTEQPRFGRPHNPDYLLRPGELLDRFRSWRMVHYFEGILDKPQRAVSQIVCRKPFSPQVSEPKDVF